MRRFHVTTLGCPKNAVDSDKLVAGLLRDGLEPTDDVRRADLVVLNTCAFVEAAREESIETALGLSEVKAPGAKLVLTGCMAERYGDELAEAFPEADAVVGFAGEDSLAHDVLEVPVAAPRSKPRGVADLLDLPRKAPDHPWAYLKVAEGCDRACAFCAIPSFRGKQVSRHPEAIEFEAASLVGQGVAELVLVAQDIAWYGKDTGEPRALAPLMERLDRLADRGLLRQRLLYLYPSEVRGALLDAVLGLPTAVPYLDLSLQHASPGLLRRMRRWGSGDRFLGMIDGIRQRRADAVFRSSFIVGFPGETEDDHDQLLEFVADAQLDWAGFFTFSPEDDTPASTMDGAPERDLVLERIAELDEVQEGVTRAKRHALVGTEIEVLVDEVDDRDGAPVAVGRSYREAPEIDGVVELVGVDHALPGAMVRARVSGVTGPDLEAEALTPVGSP